MVYAEAPDFPRESPPHNTQCSFYPSFLLAAPVSSYCILQGAKVRDPFASVTYHRGAGQLRSNVADCLKYDRNSAGFIHSRRLKPGEGCRAKNSEFMQQPTLRPDWTSSHLLTETRSQLSAASKGQASPNINPKRLGSCSTESTPDVWKQE